MSISVEKFLKKVRVFDVSNKESKDSVNSEFEDYLNFLDINIAELEEVMSKIYICTITHVYWYEILQDGVIKYLIPLPHPEYKKTSTDLSIIASFALELAINDYNYMNEIKILCKDNILGF